MSNPEKRPRIDVQALIANPMIVTWVKSLHDNEHKIKDLEKQIENLMKKKAKIMEDSEHTKKLLEEYQKGEDSGYTEKLLEKYQKGRE